MEIRMRSAVSRTAKGYSIEATLDMGKAVDIERLDGREAQFMLATEVDDLGAFQITALRVHMAALGAAFPKEE